MNHKLSLQLWHLSVELIQNTISSCQHLLVNYLSLYFDFLYSCVTFPALFKVKHNFAWTTSFLKQMTDSCQKNRKVLACHLRPYKIWPQLITITVSICILFCSHPQEIFWSLWNTPCSFGHQFFVFLARLDLVIKLSVRFSLTFVELGPSYSTCKVTPYNLANHIHMIWQKKYILVTDSHLYNCP